MRCRCGDSTIRRVAGLRYWCALVPVMRGGCQSRCRAAAVRQNPAGFSLVELMIAMVLGLLLIGGSITIFLGTARSSELSLAITQLQGNARFVLDELSMAIRAAGFRGCTGAEESILTLSTDAVPANTLVSESIRGAEIKATSWVPSGPPDYVAPTGPGAPVVGTQALILQYAAAPGHLLVGSMGSDSSFMTVQGPVDDMRAGDLALISNCKSVDVFRVATIGGNVTTPKITPDGALSQPYTRSVDYPRNTRIYPFVNRVYYIGDTGRTNLNGDPVRALYRQDLPFNTPAGNPPLELVEGVEQMQLRFGVQENGYLRYLDASNSGDPEGFSVVQLGFLMSSLQRFSEADSGRVYKLAGHTVSSSGSSAPGLHYPADSRIRLPFSTTIKVRNHGLAGG